MHLYHLQIEGNGEFSVVWKTNRTEVQVFWLKTRSGDWAIQDEELAEVDGNYTDLGTDAPPIWVE